MHERVRRSDARRRAAGRLHDALPAAPRPRPCAGGAAWRPPGCRGLGGPLGAGAAAAAGCGRDRSRSRSASTRVGAYGSGSGSRSSRFIRSSRPARSAATASGSCRAALAMMPIMNKRCGRGCSARRDQRQLDTGDRQQADHVADVDERLADHPHRGGGGQQSQERVGGALARSACRCRRTTRTTPAARTPPTKPSSSPMMAKMKSLCALGR